MKKVISMFTLFIVVVTVFSCASMKEIRTDNVKLGINKEELHQTLGKKPDNIVTAKKYDEGNVEIIQYSDYYNKYDVSTNALNPIWFYFFNDKLIKWEPKPKFNRNYLGDDILDNFYYTSIKKQQP